MDSIKNNAHNFDAFMVERENAATAYVRGNVAPLEKLAARVSPATAFEANGGIVHGAENVFAVYKKDALRFAAGDSHFEILQMAASDELGYWVGFQRVSAHVDGGATATLLNLRVTEVFCREGDQWKLLHRHADVMTLAQS